jgi:hypothetical protein
MQPKGLLNAEAIIEGCKKALLTLGDGAKPEWVETLNSTVSTLEDMQGKFFLKTNFAIPVTNALLKDLNGVQSIAMSGDLAGMAEAITRVKTGLENLVQRGKMDGVSLT